MALPLLRRTTEFDARFVLSPKVAAHAKARAPLPDVRMPARLPRTGEQYRFHVDMGSCIGCKCCVVACNEQNGNPAAINWRRVGEIEGGFYPARQPLVPLDGLQPLRRADLPERLSGRRLHEGSGHRHRAAQRRRLHRLPVLHLELLLRRAAVQPRARRRRQVRHVPRPARARPGAGLRQRVPGRRDRDRDRQRRGVARRRRRCGRRARAAVRSTAACRRRASRCRRTCRPTRRPVDLDHVAPEHPHWSLVVHDGADAALGRRVRRRSGCCSCSARRRGSGVAALTSLAGRRRWRSAASTLHLGRPVVRLSRAEDVAALVAEPRGAAVRARSPASPALYAAMLWLGIAGQRVASAR